MKRMIAIILAAVLGAAGLVSCAPSGKADKGLSVVTTIFPEYEWVKNVLGDKAEDTDVTLLLDSGVDLHSYQPTADDIIKISSCDVFIYVGGESDKWVDDALGEAANKDMTVLGLMDVLGDHIREEEIVEGMQVEDEGEAEYDEHVWLSLKNAALCVGAIGDALAKADGANAETYKANAEAYIAKLNELDGRYAAAVEASPKKTLLFGDRFPFRYMTDDYGLGYYAAFVGCSAESEASFETVAFLASKVDELGLSTVLTLEGTDHRIAETVVSATAGKDARILSMDSMQSSTMADIKAGVTYLSIMEKNLGVLTDALK